jgi:hypothetical protein
MSTAATWWRERSAADLDFPLERIVIDENGAPAVVDRIDAGRRRGRASRRANIY